MHRIAVFISKNGADLQCVIDACADYYVKGNVEFVVSSSEDALGLKRAQDAGITTLFFDPQLHKDRESFYRQAAEHLKRLDIDWIFLVEYGEFLPGFFVDEFFPKILGAYPSLDPQFLGSVDPGFRSAEHALEEGLEETGAHVYVVNRGSDPFGLSIAVEKVPVFPETDTAWTIYNRVKKAEHHIIPAVLAKFTSGEYVMLPDGQVEEHEVVSDADRFLF